VTIGHRRVFLSPECLCGMIENVYLACLCANANLQIQPTSAVKSKPKCEETSEGRQTGLTLLWVYVQR